MRQAIVDFSDKGLYNQIYLPILRDKKRYIHLKGGGGSGKSVFQAQKEIIQSFTRGNCCLCLRKVKDTHRDSCFAQLQEIINLWGLEDQFDTTVSPLYIRNKLTGSDFIFRGMDNPEKIKSVVGVTRAWLEEATELTNKDFNQIDLRLRGIRDLQISLTYNPVDKDHWLNTDFWVPGENEDTTLLSSTFLDNKWAGPQYAKVMARLKEQDPNMYNIYALGEWGNKVEGLIFNIVEIDDVPEEARLLGHGQDFGFTNDPSAFISLYKWNSGLVLDERFYRTGLTNSDICALYRSLGISTTDRIIGDSSEPKSIEEIHRQGFNIEGVDKGPDSVMFGIQTMKQYTLYVTKSSTNLLKEFKNYCWAKDRTGKVLNKPIDAFNHGIDAARYVISQILGIPESEIRLSFI